MRFSVEFAHADLASPNWSDVERSALVARSLRRHLTSLGHEVQLCVLLDDKSTSVNDRAALSTTLLEKLADLAPDYYCFERDLSAYVDGLGARLSGRPQRQLARTVKKYRSKNGGLPCSVDIALWHLVRLGLVEDHDRIIRAKDPSVDPIVDLAISVLGERNLEHELVASKDILDHVEPGIAERVWRLYFPEDPDQPFGPTEADVLVQAETKEFLACPQS